MKSNYNKLIKGLLVFLLYVLVPYVLDMFLPSITKSNSFELLYRFMFMFLLLLLYIFIYREDIKEDIKAFKKNKKDILLKSLMYFGILLVGYGVISATIQFAILGDRPLNNSNIIDILMQENTFLTIFYVFIISLFTEAIVFRKVFKDIITNKVFYVIFSGLIYALFQIGYNISGRADLLALALYSYVGMLLSYTYVKTDNIITPCLVYLFYDLFVLFAFTFNI